MTFKFTFAAIVLVLFASCSEWISYSPYDTDVTTRHPNAGEMTAIQDATLNEPDTFRFAVISDIHDNYDDLSDAISLINKHQDLIFVTCCGDITNSGLARQFEWYVDEIEKSVYPFITLIGNHDYRSNGHGIYKKIFGSTNFSFVAGKYKFVFFNNVIWENSNRSPDYDWLQYELDDESCHKILMAHIPPWGEQMRGDNDLSFCKAVNSDNTMLCIYGHNHCYADTCYNGIHTLSSKAIRAREYYIVSLVKDQSYFERIRY